MSDIRDPEKQELRERLWRTLEVSGAARFPGTRGRIPNFVGAEAAADRLTGLDAFRDARTIKVNPDSPQRPVRYRALKAGKTVVMAAPRLRAAKPFLLLDPGVLPPSAYWRASSIVGAEAAATPVPLEGLEPIDLIVTGCVGAGRDGARLGKGGGYSDLEWAVLVTAGKVQPTTPIVTTVHRAQVVDAETIPVRSHDQSLDLIVTAEASWTTESSLVRPAGVDWELLPEERLAEMPLLSRLHRDSNLHAPH